MNVQMEPTLSAGYTPGERDEKRGESSEKMPNVVCNVVFLSVIGSI